MSNKLKHSGTSEASSNVYNEHNTSEWQLLEQMYGGEWSELNAITQNQELDVSFED